MTETIEDENRETTEQLERMSEQLDSYIAKIAAMHIEAFKAVETSSDKGKTPFNSEMTGYYAKHVVSVLPIVSLWKQQRVLDQQKEILVEQRAILTTSQEHLNELKKDSKAIRRWTIIVALLTAGLIYFAAKLDYAVNTFEEALHNTPTTNKVAQ